MTKNYTHRILTHTIKTLCIGIIILIMSLMSTGCIKLTSDNNSTVSNQSSEETATENYVYDSFSNITYKPAFEYEYENLLSEQGKMYYDAISNYSWELTYLYYFDNGDDYEPDSADKAKKFYGYDHPESELIDFKLCCIESGYSGQNYYAKTAIFSNLNNEEEYLAQKTEYLKKIEEIDSEISDLVETVNAENDTIAKYQLIYDWITTNVNYDYDELSSIESSNSIICNDSYNIYGAIVKKKAVCDGISDAFKYICNKCDLECLIICGDLDYTINEVYGHQWNIVPIYDSWFLIDCTFDLKTSNNDIYGSYFTYDDSNLYVLKSKPCCFLYDDITLDGRIPEYDNVYGYSEDYKSDKYLPLTFISNNNANVLETEEGISLTCSSDYNIQSSPTSQNAYFTLTEDSLNNIIYNNDDSSYYNINFSSNGKISHVMFFYYNNLLSIEDCDGDLTFDLLDKDTNKYISKMIIFVEYSDKTYKIPISYFGL